MNSASLIRIAIVDDHPMIRRGVRMTFGQDDGFEVVGEGATGQDAIELARSLAPDIMLIDLSMPGGGLDAVDAITQHNPAVKVAILSISDDLGTVRRSFRTGAAGFISKGADSGELVEGVRRIVRGERYISPDLAVRLLQIAPEEEEAEAGMAVRAGVSLTKRERSLLELLGEGLSNSDIASRTGLAETTVKQYVSALLQKLGVKNRTAAALMARSYVGDGERRDG